MQNISHQSDPAALAQADALVKANFWEAYRVSTLTAYFDLIDHRTTAHLAPQLKKQVLRSAGAQHRNAVFQFASDGQLIVKIAMKDPRSSETLWAIMEARQWFDLLEMGAEGKWVFNYKSANSDAGQVRVSVPMKRGAKGLATIARLIVNAKFGQQARLHDRNPLNLRRSNLYLIGNPQGPEGKAGNAKADTRAVLKEGVELRASLAGKKYHYGENNGE